MQSKVGIAAVLTHPESLTGAVPFPKHTPSALITDASGKVIASRTDISERTCYRYSLHPSVLWSYQPLDRDNLDLRDVAAAQIALL